MPGWGSLPANQKVSAPYFDSAFAKDDVEALFADWETVFERSGAFAPSTPGGEYALGFGGYAAAIPGAFMTYAETLDRGSFDALGRQTWFRIVTSVTCTGSNKPGPGTGWYIATRCGTVLRATGGGSGTGTGGASASFPYPNIGGVSAAFGEDAVVTNPAAPSFTRVIGASFWYTDIMTAGLNNYALYCHISNTTNVSSYITVSARLDVGST